MKKKLVSLALGLGLMAAAAGCSSKPKETEKATEAKTEAKTEAQQAQTAAQTEAEQAVSEAVAEVMTEAAEVMTEAPAAAGMMTEAMTEAPAAAEMMTEAMTEVPAAAEMMTEAMTEAPAAAEMMTEAMTEAPAAAEMMTEEQTEAPTMESITEAVTEMAEEAMTEAAMEGTTEAADMASDIIYTVELSDEETRGTVADFNINSDEIVVLYNNDVHGGISENEDYSGSSLSLGYAGMAGVKEEVAAKAGALTVVDLGDAIQGSVVTTETNGEAVMKLMEKIGYDIFIPGNHDYDYGMDTFLEYAKNTGDKFLCANFIDKRTGEAVFDSYRIITYTVGGRTLRVGYVGLSTPESISKSTPTYFQDEDGNYIYGFNAEKDEDLYECVQDAVDGAYADGADLVVALGHMGDTGVEPGWSSRDVIANTNGISVFLDGHAHSIIPGEMVQNKDGEDVLLSSTGTKLEHIGVLKLGFAEEDKITASTGLVDEVTQEELAGALSTEVAGMVKDVEDELAYLFVKEGTTDFDLVIYDPSSDPENPQRLIRMAETNMGDFLTDAYRNHFKADIGMLNGGSIRADISAGDITYMDLVTVFPWNTPVSVVEVPGQVVLDCLEMGARLYPEESGGWMQVSGLTYLIDSTIPSTVQVNSDGEFVSVDGEYRVKNVMVGEEPLDPEKLYKVAINTYYSKEFGDGMTMFKGCKILVPAEGEEDIIDHDVLIDYLAEIGGAVPEEYQDPYGQGRFTVVTEENKELLESAEAVSEAAAEGIGMEAVSEAATEGTGTMESETEEK